MGPLAPTGDSGATSADDTANNILAAGGLSALVSAGVLALPNSRGVSFEVEMEDGQATNRLVLRLPFLKSPYRVTVERIADDTAEATTP